MTRPSRLRSLLLAIFALIAFVPELNADVGGIKLPAPTAIINARIIPTPGEFIEGGTIIIQDGRVTAVGRDIPIPVDAEKFDASGLVVYPGFIDGLTHRGMDATDRTGAELARLADDDLDVTQDVQSATVQAQRRLIHPDWMAAERYDASIATRDDARAAGFTAALVSPEDSIFSGISAVVSLGDEPARRSILNPSVAQHAAFVTQAGSRRGPFGGGGGYPVTTMGAIAAFRQALMDADWHRDLVEWSARHPEGKRAPFDPALVALEPIIDGKIRVAFLANSEDEIHRALNVAEEFDIKPVIVGGREAWKAADRLKAADVPVLLSLKWSDKPEKPKKRPDTAPTADVSSDNPLAQPMDRSPVFDEAWQDQPWETKRVFEERERKRFEEVDNAKSLFEAGVSFAFASYELESPKDVLKGLQEAIERGLTEDAVVSGLTASPAAILGVQNDCGAIMQGKLANLTLLSDRITEKKCEVKWVFVNGRSYDVALGAKKRDKKKDDKTRGDRDDASSQPTTGEAENAPATTQPASQPASTTAPTSQGAEEDVEFPMWPDEIEADRKPRFQTGGNLLIRNATLLTLTGADLEETDLLIQEGKIAATGKHLTAPAGTESIDLRGYYVSPGLIDPHSHICSSGGLNEWSLSATPEVRVRDVINSKDVAAFRALAGGVTAIHTMHGSANTIGGQNVVLRLKYGKPASQWRFKDAPTTVKFALGENVKQSNGDRRGTRFPNSRMGVESVFYRSFDRAVDYATSWDEFNRDAKLGKDPRPLRKDLRLEALCDINAGRIWVHCHCYRADEVLRLLTMAEHYGFRIGVLQHILEGYRVIPEIFRHGCSASTFSDWWAYKIEAFDATPFNAARMEQGGIVTTINSDSAEVMRHLNLEAAKSMRFGGLSPREAMRLCTLNGAIQLGIDQYVGSIEVGKLADLAIFDGHPLDTLSRCMLTLIDGEVYFQHPEFEPTLPPTPLGPKEFVTQQPAIEIPESSTGEYILRGGTVHTIDGESIPSGVVVIRDGRIASVGADAARSPESASAVEVDATGYHIYPGLICAGVPLGLMEIDSVAGTVDANDIARFQPDLHALSGYNPFSSLIGVARSEGVTTTLVSAGGGVVQSLAGLVHLDGWSMPEARMEAPEQLFVQLPSKSTQKPWWMDEKDFQNRNKEFATSLAEVEEFFRLARQYALMTELHRNGKSGAPARDRRLEAMLPYITRERPVIFRASGYKEIAEALRFADKYELKPIIFGGREAWKLADVLAERHIDVIIARSMAMPASEYEQWNSVYRNAGILHRRGVRFCFSVAEPSLTKQLGIEAGMAAAHGLEPAQAIRAITLDAAAILGVDDQTGSITKGKLGDIIVTTDSPLQADNCVVAEFIAGRPVDLANKHTESDDLFQSRPAPKLPPARDDLRGPHPMRLK